jgi:hypothetical protein
VHISGVDFLASEADVLATFRSFYRAALCGAQPWYGRLLAWDIQRLSPEEAILGVHLVRAKKKRFPTQKHGGHGYVALVNTSVGELFCAASKRPELICAPSGGAAKRKQGVSVQRRWGKKYVDVNSTHDFLGVSRVQMIDLDRRVQDSRYLFSCMLHVLQ